jgi:adenine phosphoribosyltransferase
MWEGNRHAGSPATPASNERFKNYVRDVPDFPKKDVLFRDITPLLSTPGVFQDAVKQIAQRYVNEHVDLIVGVEARGFIIGGSLANEMGRGFVPVRKLGKLPGRCYSQEYDLEYGSTALEIQEGSIHHGQSVLVVDDVLATGGTAHATELLVQKLGGIIRANVFLIELLALKGRGNLSAPAYSLMQY